MKRVVFPPVMNFKFCRTILAHLNDGKLWFKGMAPKVHTLGQDSFLSNH